MVARSTRQFFLMAFLAGCSTGLTSTAGGLSEDTVGGSVSVLLRNLRNGTWDSLPSRDFLAASSSSAEAEARLEVLVAAHRQLLGMTEPLTTPSAPSLGATWHDIFALSSGLFRCGGYSNAVVGECAYRISIGLLCTTTWYPPQAAPRNLLLSP